MFTKNIYYRLKYQFSKKAITQILFLYVLDRLKHPFISKIKKQKKEGHKNYLISKKTTTDYFSLNAYYWDLIINKNSWKLMLNLCPFSSLNFNFLPTNLSKKQEAILLNGHRRITNVYMAHATSLCDEIKVLLLE